MKRRILITGGAGNIGGSLSRRLASDPDNEVVVVDSLLTGRMDKLPTAGPTCRFIKADCNRMSDIAPVMSAYRFDYVFHYAAVVGVKRTLENPCMVLDDIKGIENVLDLAKSTGVRRVFFSSSSEVYGEPVELPQREETTPLNSRLPYAVVKNVGESYFKAYLQEFGLEYTIFRFFNTYGPLQSEDFVVARFLSLALAGAAIIINGDGQQTRTFLYIDDNIDLTQRLLYENLGVNEVINVGSDAEISILDLARLVIRLTRSTSSIEHGPPLKEGDMTRRQPDIARMRTFLGRDLTSLEPGIAKMLAFRRAGGG
jgi:UDP-glucose 4-epimerase